MKQDDLIRFMSYVDKQPGGCWLWTGSLNSSGYGHFRLDDYTYTTHRLIYEHCFGPIGDSTWEVCHECDIRHCVNPQHLFTALHEGNMRDCLLKDRHPTAKLTVAIVRQIKTRLEAGERGDFLAKEFGVADSRISQIKTGKSWRDI